MQNQTSLGSVWLKSQVERSRSVSVLLLFGYKVTRTEWLQLGNILLRSGTIPLQKINRTEPLHSHPALTVTLCSVYSATKQKTKPLCSRLPNTEQSGSVARIKDGTTPLYLAPQPNTSLVQSSGTHQINIYFFQRIEAHNEVTRVQGSTHALIPSLCCRSHTDCGVAVYTKQKRRRSHGACCSFLGGAWAFALSR
jgi:hypothetical protein